MTSRNNPWGSKTYAELITEVKLASDWSGWSCDLNTSLWLVNTDNWGKCGGCTLITLGHHRLALKYNTNSIYWSSKRRLKLIFSVRQSWRLRGRGWVWPRSMITFCPSCLTPTPGITCHGLWLVNYEHVTSILASDWSIQTTWDMTWILASDWSTLVTWPQYWPLIGQFISRETWLGYWPLIRQYWTRDLNTSLWLVNSDHVRRDLDTGLWLVMSVSAQGVRANNGLMAHLSLY